MKNREILKSNHAWICSLGLPVFELSELESIFHISLESGGSKEDMLFSSSMKVVGFLKYIFIQHQEVDQQKRYLIPQDSE